MPKFGFTAKQIDFRDFLQMNRYKIMREMWNEQLCYSLVEGEEKTYIVLFYKGGGFSIFEDMQMEDYADLTEKLHKGLKKKETT